MSLPAPSIERRNAPGRTAQVVADELIQGGVDKIFALPGGPIGPVFDALLDRPEVEVVVTRHETGAVQIACGYAMATGRPGVALTTCGPGLTNALTGLVTAREECIPLVLLAGDVPSVDHDRTSVQEVGPYGLDLAKGFRPAVKASLTITRPSLAAPTIRRALEIAAAGKPGPVLVILPLDVSMSPAESFPLVDLSARVHPSPDPAVWDDLVLRLREAEQPLLLVGSGVRASGTWREVLELAERTSTPFATTPHAKGTMPEDHPLALGVHGLCRSRWALQYLGAGPDLLVALGTRLSDISTGGYRPLTREGGAIVQIDVDPTHFGRSVTVERAIEADLRVALPELLGRLDVRRRPRVNPALSLAKRGSRVEREEDLASDAVPLIPPRALADLLGALPEDAFLISDIGEHGLFALHYLEVREPDSFYMPVGSCTMGTGITMGIGLAMGKRDRSVVCLTGDGCMGMHGLELITARTLDLPLTVVVFNDASYGMVKFGNRRVFGRSHDFETHPVDFAGLARSIGGIGVEIREPGALRAEHLTLARRERRLVVIDVHVDKNLAAPGNNRVNQMAEAGTPRSL